MDMFTKKQENIIPVKGYKQVSKDEFLKTLQGPTKEEIQKNAEKLTLLLTNIQNKTLSQTPDVITCIVKNCNNNGTIDVYPIGEENIVWTIQNQSIYKDIPVGSPVKVFKQDRNNNINMWIGAVNSIENKKDILYVLREDELEFFVNHINFLKYKLDCLFELAKDIAEFTYIRCSGSDEIKRFVSSLKEIHFNEYDTKMLNITKNLKKTKDSTISKGLFK